MRLTELLTADGATMPPAAPGGDPEIAGLSADSRSVAPGFLFAALPGAQMDGRDFIADAVARGAVAVLAPPDTRLKAGPDAAKVALVTDTNPRRLLALMAARFYGAQPRCAAAVTGTNGKTSVAWFTRQIWSSLGHEAASVGTLGIIGPDGRATPSLTTPEPVALHRALEQMAAEGVDRVVLEASSHGIEQCRLDGVAFAAGAFTNLTRDHLDYHGSAKAYRAAKLRLFDTLLPAGGAAVLNADAADFAAFAEASRARGLAVLSYGRAGEDLRIAEIRPEPTGQTVTADVLGRRREIRLKLPGAFQAENALCALGLAIACGDDPADAADALSTLSAVPGRIDLAARRANGAPIYVDYAHTPDALETVLRALRPHAQGRLVVVFGCGGDRDRGKRPMMGEIAGRLSDVAIVTDDNPRGEDAAAIRREIRAACPDAVEIGDRAEAIRAAAGILKPGDVLVVAGKGHETGQIVGGVVRPFDDADAARAAVALLDGGRP